MMASRRDHGRFVYLQGDSVEAMKRLNDQHDPNRGVLVVHLHPRSNTPVEVDFAVRQSLGQRLDEIETRRGLPEITWSHWLAALGVRRIVFFPAESLDENTVKALENEGREVEIWMAARRNEDLITKLIGLGYHQGSLRELEELAGAFRSPHESDSPLEPVNYLPDSWPGDPLKARFESLGYQPLDLGRFSHRFVEAFWAASRVSKMKAISARALSRVIRVHASDSRGRITAGGYCGIWSAMFRAGQFLEDPLVCELTDTGPTVEMPNFHLQPSVDHAVVYGLASMGFSLGEIGAIRVDQVEPMSDGSTYIVGVRTTGHLAAVLRGAVVRRRSQSPDAIMIWKPLVETKDNSRRTGPPREEQLRHYYRDASQLFRRNGVNAPAKFQLVAKAGECLSDLVKPIPNTYVKLPLNPRDLEILREGSLQTGWPIEMVRDVITSDDDLTNLARGRYLEKVRGQGFQVDPAVLMSQGFSMDEHTQMLFERARYDAQRANSRNSRGTKHARSSTDLHKIAAALDSTDFPNRLDLSR